MKSAWSGEGRTAGTPAGESPGRLSGSLLSGQVLALGMEAAWWWGVGEGGKGGWPPRWTVEPLTGSEQLLRGLMCLPSGSLASQAGPGSIAGKGLPAGPVRGEQSEPVPRGPFRSRGDVICHQGQWQPR